MFLFGPFRITFIIIKDWTSNRLDTVYFLLTWNFKDGDSWYIPPAPTYFNETWDSWNNFPAQHLFLRNTTNQVAIVNNFTFLIWMLLEISMIHAEYVKNCPCQIDKKFGAGMMPSAPGLQKCIQIAIRLYSSGTMNLFFCWLLIFCSYLLYSL